MGIETDVLVVGAGPAGAAASIALSQAGCKHIVIDKAQFPRDKICGDALSGKVVHLLKKMNPAWPEMLAAHARSMPSHGVIFVAPNGTPLEIPFNYTAKADEPAPGFVSPRMAFDNWIKERAQETGGEWYFESPVQTIEKTESGFRVMAHMDGKAIEVSAKLLIGAGGDRCPVAKWSGIKKMEPNHYCAGVRTYYEGVQNLHPRGFIELHFIPEFLPGYLWIFPMTDGMANVGAGILSAEASKRKFNLKAELQKVLQNHPALVNRFAYARQIGKTEGWGLPLGSKKRPLSGEGFMLCGDAASLIDPFTGEGIGNGMLSGFEAGKLAAQSILSGNPSHSFLKRYDEVVYLQLADELRTSRILQKLTRYQWLFNFVVARAAASDSLRYTISAMFEDVEARKEFKNPLFYLKLLTGN